MNPFLIAAVVLALFSGTFFFIEIRRTLKEKRMAALEFKFRTCQITHEEMDVLERLRS
jgi:hypothetical protein